MADHIREQGDSQSNKQGAVPPWMAHMQDGSNNQESQDDGPRRRNRRLIIGIIVGVVVVALVAGYIVGINHYGSHYLPNTTINGCDVAGLTVDEARQRLENETAEYACEVSVGGFSLRVPSTDVGLERDEDRIAQEAMNRQRAFAWPLALFVQQAIAVDQGATFNEDVLVERALTAVDEYNEATLPSTDATIRYDDDQANYVLEGTVSGQALTPDVVREAALETMRALSAPRVLTEGEAFHVATVQDLPKYAHAVEWANRSRGSDISILVDGEEVIESDAEQNAEWVTIGEGPAVVVDEDAVYAWADSSVIYAAYHRDDWTDYFLDEDKFVEEFCKRLATGVVDPYEAPMYSELRSEGESRELAYEHGGWDSSMGRYIDVDLDAQFARLFDEKGTVIWESAFVSGSMIEGRPTVTGTFSIYAMQTNTVLVGMDYNNDGKPDYESFVNYWMPFYGGFGLHDATWRANFGGELYYYGGSHGCINLPYEKAEELFGITFVGEVVYVHW